MDFRKKAVELYNQGKSVKEISKNIGFNIISDFSWGSIPVEKKPNKFIKAFFDKYVKLFNRGDVMLFLCKK